MAIDKNSISMMSPVGDGGNFGISSSFSYKDHGNQPTNYNECIRSLGNSKNIDMMISKVSKSGASGQDSQDVSDGGIHLGQPLKSDGRAN